MESNMYKVNHLESDVLLPPRKRLLAGFKKQISDGNGSSSPSAIASSSNASPATSSEVQTHLDSLLASRLNDPNLTPEEIAEASRSAAIAAAEVAKAARATADEKAEIAAKAVAAAKTALSLVQSRPKEAVSIERCAKKSKLKKKMPVELVYSKDDKPRESHGSDEELAVRLNRAVNSSHRILKSCSGSELKGRKHKKQKGLDFSGSSNANGNRIELYNVDSKSKSDHCKEKPGGDTNFPGRKRGRVKIKKLPLIKCSSKEESSPSAEKISGDTPLFRQAGATDSVVAASMWKCKDLKASECVKQKKVLQS